jgi:hypothetical protein
MLRRPALVWRLNSIKSVNYVMYPKARSQDSLQEPSSSKHRALRRLGPGDPYLGAEDAYVNSVENFHRYLDCCV